MPTAATPVSFWAFFEAVTPSASTVTQDVPGSPSSSMLSSICRSVKLKLPSVGRSRCLLTRAVEIFDLHPVSLRFQYQWLQATDYGRDNHGLHPFLNGEPGRDRHRFSRGGGHSCRRLRSCHPARSRFRRLGHGTACR